MSDKTTTTSGGSGFIGLLTILFIGLKLTGHITWSWWWVLSPLWIGFAIVLGIFTTILVVASLAVFIIWLISLTKPK